MHPPQELRERREEDQTPSNQAPEIDDIQPPSRNVQRANIGVLQPPCRHSTGEACGQGNSCLFLHEGDNIQQEVTRPRPNIHQPNLGHPVEENNLQVRRVCRDFAQGRCYRGAHCRFLHDTTTATVADNQVWQSIIDSFDHIN